MTIPARRGPELPLPALIAATLAFALGFAQLVHAKPWPSSDLEGHIATIDLYRTSLSNGVFWPYDQRSGLGFDGTPYYSWCFELLLGAVALLLGVVGVTKAAAITAIGVIVCSVAALPLTAAWCARQLAPPDLTPDRRRQVGHAGAIAAFVFLAGDSSDGVTGIGMGTVAMGMLNQCVGWNLLLLLVGAAAGSVHRKDRWRINLPVAFATAGLVLAHTMSALAGALAMLPFLAIRPKALIASGGLGALTAAAGIAAVSELGDRLIPLVPWKAFSGSDPVLAIFGPLITGTGIERVWIPASVVAGGALLVCALRALRGTGPARTAAIASILITVAACLPAVRLLMPGQSQPYRLNSLALLLVLVAGAAASTWLVAYLEARARRSLRIAIIGTLWCGLFFQQAGGWPNGDGMPTPDEILAELKAHVPSSSRVVFSDRVGWHRWALEEWKRSSDWETINSMHIPVLPPTASAAQAAAESIGAAPQFFSWTPTMPTDQAARILSDMGFTHVIVTDVVGQAEPSMVEPGPMPPESWPHIRTEHADIWRIPDTGPRLEAIAGDLIGIHLSNPRQHRILLAEWWARIRARHGLTARLVIDPRADEVKSMIDDRADPPTRATPADLTAVPAFTGTHVLFPWGNLRQVSNAFYRAMSLAEHVLATGGSAEGQPSRGGTFHWSGSGQAAEFDGLTPGVRYLWRYAYSPGMRASGGHLLEEASGFCVLVPETSRMAIGFSRVHGRVIAGIVLSLAAVVMLLSIATVRLVQGSGSE